MSDSNEMLLSLQRLQFRDKAAAEDQLKGFLRKNDIHDLVDVRLNVKPESLNSLNGIATFQDGTQLFFKSHTEENELLSSYYDAKILAEAGYPMVQPRKLRTVPGEQIAFYEVVSFPTLFDLAKIEEDRLIAGESLSPTGEKLVNAQQRLESKLLSIYRSSLLSAEQSPIESSPIHQLFSERLKPSGRLGLFYLDKKLTLSQQTILIDDLFSYRWKINGVEYRESIGELIGKAQRLLNPASRLPTIVGHGDAHNGNVFWNEKEEELLYFDPAFAGRHPALLDIVKPLFHNVFARWMYFPDQVDSEISLSYKLTGSTIEIEHNFVPSSLRYEFLRMKSNGLLEPILRELHSPDWVDYLKSALFCCPLLTVNLAASYDPLGKLAETYPESIKLLGFAMAMEVGATAARGSNPIRELCSVYEELGGM